MQPKQNKRGVGHNTGSLDSLAINVCGNLTDYVYESLVCFTTVIRISRITREFSVIVVLLASLATFMICEVSSS